jgi:hypothetical protein
MSGKLESSEYNLSREIEAARLLIQQLKEIGADDDIQLVGDTIEGELNIQQAVEAVVKSIVEQDEVLIEGINKVRAELESRKTAAESRIERKRTMILTAMQLADLKKIVTPHRTVSRKSIPAKLLITDESLIPGQYFKRPDPVPDKAQLTKTLKELEDVLEGITKMEAGDERNAALEAFALKRIPGVELSNGGETVALRS